MILLRKLKTAKSVLARYGLKEALGLAGDNIASLLSVLFRRIARLSRRVAGRAAVNLPRVSKKMRVLYVTTEFEAFHSQTVRYRVHNVRKALRGQAKTRFELSGDGICTDKASLKWADIIVLMRAAWTDEVGGLISAAKEIGIPVVFDIDDIIFMPEYAGYYCRALGDMSEKNVNDRKSEFEGFEKTFKNCDFGTASTNFIAEKMERAGTRAFVIHNGLNKKQLRIARHTRKKVNNVRAIGYLSGTKTHDRDFEQALPALKRIMAEYPDVVLRVAGYLDLSVLPPALAERVRPACYMNWGRLMKYGAQNYINIAPLDAANPFCNAKSELKYFEAAAAHVPTVASATDTFSRCIQNGRNGMLAANDGEWYNALKKLLDDKEFYVRVAEGAYNHALEHYSPKASANEALAAYGAIVADFHSGQRGA
jgi:glycosyltransferase involved in cell wall biosynthesis